MRLLRWKPSKRIVVQNVNKRDSASCNAASSEDSENKRSGSKRYSERLPLQRIRGVWNYFVIRNSVIKFFFSLGSKSMSLLSSLYSG